MTKQTKSARQSAALNRLDAAYKEKLFIWFFIALLVFFVYLFFQVIKPFFHSLILAGVFTALSYPFYTRCLKLTKGNKTLAALIILFCVAVIVSVPVTLFILGLIPQAAESISAVNRWIAGQHIGELISTYVDPLLAWLNTHFPDLDLTNLNLRGTFLEYSRKTGQLLLGYGTYILGNIVMMTLHFGLILLTMFYLLRNGEEILKKVRYLSPLKPHQTAILIERMKAISRSVFAGGLFVASLQGVVGGIGLAIVGIHAIFWGTVMAFAALVPVLGTGLVWIPACVYLFLVGETGKAVFLLAWCAGIVCTLDTILRPILLRGGMRMPVLLLFLAIIGGVNAYGILGLLYGPMILGLTAVLLSIYGEEYHGILSNREGADEENLAPKEE